MSFSKNSSASALGRPSGASASARQSASSACAPSGCAVEFAERDDVRPATRRANASGPTGAPVAPSRSTEAGPGGRRGGPTGARLRDRHRGTGAGQQRRAAFTQPPRENAPSGEDESSAARRDDHRARGRIAPSGGAPAATGGAARERRRVRSLRSLVPVATPRPTPTAAPWTSPGCASRARPAWTGGRVRGWNPLWLCCCSRSAGAAFLFKDELKAQVQSVGGGAVAVRTARAERVVPGDAKAGDVQANGYVIADRSASLASVISGRLVELNAKEGDTVEKDAVVARVQYDDLEAIEAEAKARTASAEAQVAQAKKAVEAARLDVPRLEAEQKTLDAARRGGARERRAARRARSSATARSCQRW